MIDKEQCLEIYTEAFGEDREFSEMLFENFFEDCRYIKENEAVVAMLFLLPCTLVNGDERIDARYLFAAATPKKMRGKGYMTRLLKECCSNTAEWIFLKPAEQSLEEFYSQRGFVGVKAIRSRDGYCRIEIPSKFERLAVGSVADASEYTLMYYGNKKNIKQVAFWAPMD